MNILSCKKLTIEQATKLNLDSTTDPDPCLLASLEDYERGFVEPSDDRIQCVNDLLELSQEYKTAYENMGENEVKCWDYKMLTKQDMFKLWKETDVRYQNERTKCVNKPYMIKDLEKDIHNVFILETDKTRFLVTDIGDALIVTGLTPEFVGYDVELTNEEYEMIDFAVLAYYEKNESDIAVMNSTRD